MTWTDLSLRQRFDRVRQAASSKPHGSRGKYASGCRCVRCRAANSRYECSRAKLRRTAGADIIVDASAARAHILALSGAGVGRRAIAAASGVALTSVCSIRRGLKTHIRRTTEQRILAVEVSAASDRALIASSQAWELLDELIERGFSRKQLAKWMGYRTPGVQFRRGKRMTARNVARVRRMYELLKQGKLRRDD